MIALKLLWWAFLLAGAVLLVVRYGGFTEGDASGTVATLGWSFFAVGVFMAVLVPLLDREKPLPPDQAEGRAPVEPRAFATLDLSRWTRRKR